MILCQESAVGASFIILFSVSQVIVPKLAQNVLIYEGVFTDEQTGGKDKDNIGVGVCACVYHM